MPPKVVFTSITWLRIILKHLLPLLRGICKKSGLKTCRAPPPGESNVKAAENKDVIYNYLYKKMPKHESTDDYPLDI
jgi:hypothetical protein